MGDCSDPAEDALWTFSDGPRTIYLTDIRWFPAEVIYWVEDPQGHLQRDSMSLRSWHRMMEKNEDIYEKP